MCNNCCRKIPTVDVTSFSAAGGITTLTTGPFSGALNCSGRFNLCIPFNLPQTEAGNTVQISTGGTTYPMQDNSGNNLLVAQLLYSNRCGCRFDSQKKFLHCRLLSAPSHVKVIDCLPEGCAVPDAPTPPVN